MTQLNCKKLQQRKKDYNMKNRRGNLLEEKREEERRKARERRARQMAGMSPDERRKTERLKEGKEETIRQPPGGLFRSTV